ncbi:MAG: galactosyltransferase-related protein [Formosimonas sp.]
MSNLIALLHYLNNTHQDYSLTLVESDVTPRFAWGDVADSKIKHLFMHCTGKFNKALLCNYAVKLATADKICILDADCVVEPDLFERLAYRLSLAETQNMVFSPYLECLNIDGDYKSVFCTAHTFEVLALINRHALPHGVTRLYDRNIGGALMIKRADYIRLGGMNASFKGWGGEDNEFFYRTRNLGMKWESFDSPLYHLHHDSHTRVNHVHNDEHRHNIERSNQMQHLSVEQTQAVADELRTFFE